MRERDMIDDHQPNLLMYFISDVVEIYNESLYLNPVLTKAMTSATVYTIGDIIAQRTEGAERLHRMRTLRSLLAGFFLHGPLSHIWYNFCEDIFNWLNWNQYWWVPFPKVILDQTTWGPCWNNIYIIFLGMMQFQKLSTIWGDVRRTTIPLILSGLKLWPFAHIITYGFVRVKHRLLWVDTVEILWVTILATQAAGKQKVKRQKKRIFAEAASNRSTRNNEDDENDEEMGTDIPEDKCH